MVLLKSNTYIYIYMIIYVYIYIYIYLFNYLYIWLYMYIYIYIYIFQFRDVIWSLNFTIFTSQRFVHFSRRFWGTAARGRRHWWSRAASARGGSMVMNYKVVPPKRDVDWFINPMNTINITPTKTIVKLELCLFTNLAIDWGHHLG